MEENKYLDKFTVVAAKFGNQVHLRSLRDAFAILMPFFILAGMAVLINNVVFPWFWQEDSLWTAQYWGKMVTNGTLNISSILLAPMIAYCLSKNKDFKNPIAATGLALSVLVVIMPFATTVTPIDAESAVDVIGIMRFSDLGTQGMFAGIIVGLLSTELFIRISAIKQLEINLGDDIPPAVGKSFNVLIPVMLVVSIFAGFSLILLTVFDTNLLDLVAKFIQEPLRGINTSLWGAILIYSIGNFLFTLGIHQTIVNGVLLMPVALINMNENMLALQNGAEIPNIITNVFIPTFGMIGGIGSTISLILATIIFGKHRATKSVAKLGTAPGIFNINEPVIFGYPIVFNLPLMIPFVLLPSLGLIIAYYATALGLMNHTVVLIPWTTPPLLSGFLATGGDWRAVIVQLIIIIMGVFIYLPFMKISERTALKMMNMN
ncbi:PTS sugar transporter subunit IIC [Enterococcus sp. N342-3-1-2]